MTTSKKYDVFRTWNGWGVFAIGPRGGRRLLMTYSEEITAIGVAFILNGKAPFEVKP